MYSPWAGFHHVALVTPDMNGTDSFLCKRSGDASRCDLPGDGEAVAVANGAVVREQPKNFVSGDRYASILDPVGIRWSIMTRVEDLSEDESHRCVEPWSKSLR